MGWNGLPDADSAQPLGDDDLQLVAELRELLARHDALDRFGLVLLHSHFELTPDEVLVETVDREARTLSVRPVNREELKGGSLLPTSFRLDRPSGAAEPIQFCWRPRGSTIHGT